LLSAEVGAEREAKDQNGRTALHVAAEEGQVEALGVLVELGACVDPDEDGGAGLLGRAGMWCRGEGAAERRAATVAALRQHGVGGDGAGIGAGGGGGRRGEASVAAEPAPEAEPEA
jgi:ankyrin repeat protein